MPEVKINRRLPIPPVESYDIIGLTPNEMQIILALLGRTFNPPDGVDLYPLYTSLNDPVNGAGVTPPLCQRVRTDRDIIYIKKEN